MSKQTPILSFNSIFSILVFLGNSALNGVLVKGSNYLESLSKCKVIAFDKTGTITYGKPTVTDVIPLNIPKEEFIKVAKSIEILSEHPLSKAISDYTKESTAYPVYDFEQIQGRGLKGKMI